MQKYVSKRCIEGYVKQKPVCGDYPTREWAEWSMKSHTEEEIKERVLENRESVCYSYICKNSRLSEKFIIELAVISLDGSITKENYTERMNKLVPLFNEFYDNRLDWLAISTYQKLSIEFIDKYKPLLDGSSIVKNQSLTEEFIKNNVCTFVHPLLAMQCQRNNISKDFYLHLELIYKNFDKYMKAINENNAEYINSIWNKKITRHEKE